MLCENITPLIVGEDQQPGVKQIFKSKPRFAYDKYFSGDSIMNYLDENRSVAVMTCRQDCIPSNITRQYFHKLETDSKQQFTEASFLHPFVAVKETYTQGVKQA